MTVDDRPLDIGPGAADVALDGAPLTIGGQTFRRLPFELTPIQFPAAGPRSVHDGAVVAGVEEPAGTRSLRPGEQLRIERAGWLAVRAGGPGYWRSRPHRDSWRRPIFAHTSPVYGRVTHHHGEADHLALLSRPYLEARDAVRDRLATEGGTG